MANYETLKSAIQQVVKTNGNNEITGALLQQSLLAIINSLGTGYQFMGVATPTTNPGTLDQKVFYIANGKGTYVNYDNINVAENDVVVLYYDTNWHKLATGIASREEVTSLDQKVSEISRNLSPKQVYSTIGKGRNVTIEIPLDLKDNGTYSLTFDDWNHSTIYAGSSYFWLIVNGVVIADVRQGNPLPSVLNFVVNGAFESATAYVRANTNALVNMRLYEIDNGTKLASAMDDIVSKYKEVVISSLPVLTQLGKQIQSNDGNLHTEANTSSVSDFIPVKPNHKYKITASSWYGYAIFALYASDKSFISAYASTTSGTKDQLKDYDIVTPNDCHYIRLSRVVHGTMSPMSINPYVLSSSHLCGKKWSCIGDSLTAVNDKTTMHYHDYIGEQTGVIVQNLGISGCGYWYGPSKFVDKVNEIPVDADIITIFGSFNDVRGDAIPLGEPTDTGTSTICGNINNTISAIYSRMPSAHLGIITPCPWDSKTPNSGSAVAYVNALKECCRLKSVPCLDLFYCSNLRPWESAVREILYTRDGGGGVHPDENGHKLISSMIKSFVESIAF